MIRTLGISLWLAVTTCAWSSPSHVGADGVEIPEDFPDPVDLSMPEVQVIRFLGTHFPEMLDEIEAAEGATPEARAELLDRARGIIFEWEEHFRMGELVAKNFIDVERLHYQNDQLVPKYLKMEEGEAKKGLGEKLRGNLAKIHDLRVNMEKAELKRLKEEIAAIEENLADSGANRVAMVESELRDLLEFWRLDQLGHGADRAREEPVIPATVIGEVVPEEIPPVTPTEEPPIEKALAVEEPVTVLLLADGTLKFGEITPTLEELSILLKGVAEKSPKTVVVIRAESDTPFENFTGVMEVCKDAGLAIALSAKPQE